MLFEVVPTSQISVSCSENKVVGVITRDVGAALAPLNIVGA
jgi:hypothetical protein